MKSKFVVAAVLILCSALVSAQNQKKKHALPAVFQNSHFVYVEAMDGNEFQPGLLPEDRRAIADMEQAVRDWNRYVLTSQASDAELVFILRTGRVASATLGASVGSPTVPAMGSPAGQHQTSGLGGSVRGGAGPADDYLEVRVRMPDGQLSAPIWQRTLADGLEGPDLPLFQQLKKAIEHDYPTTQAKQAKP